MSDALRLAESLLVFRNSQGRESRGTLMNVTRHVVVFEVYNPYSIVQLSEVLHDLRIHRGERIIYQGRAVVSNLVNTGLMLIVSATLVDEWSLLSGLETGADLRAEVSGFVEDWQQTRMRLRPEYQNLVTNFRDFLVELSRWLGQGETVAGLDEPGVQAERVRGFVSEVEQGVAPQLRELMAAFEREAAAIDPETVTLHKSFARRELHPLILCSPFVHRTFTKPLGYAGDYEMVNMITRDPIEGQNAYAKVINVLILRSGAAEAHRNRIALLVETLVRESARVAADGRRLNALNIGCGPAAEVQRFVREHAASQDCRFTLLDFNAETLDHARDRIVAAQRASGRGIGLELVHKSIHDLLKDAIGRRDVPQPGEGTYDLVYCAGLFDYLSDKVCQRLFALFTRLCRPGGLVLATNVHLSNPDRHYMEHIMEWHLIYRDEDGMRRLAPPGLPSEVRRDSTGHNIFLECRK